MLLLAPWSFGIGDRFGRQASFQLRAFQKLLEDGVEVTPVWNKSNREHALIGSEPSQVFRSAQQAVTEAGWTGPWHIDADHIRQQTVDRFLDASDFFTIDVADSIGKPSDPSAIQQFIRRHEELRRELAIPGIARTFRISDVELEWIATKYLAAVQEAASTYRYIAERKGEGTFITEVSMDETDEPQSPSQLLVILAALADEGLPVQTLAPKFSGRFNKGIDFVGSLEQFEQEFREDLAVMAFAIEQYGLPVNLKLSVHSGSDKFSLYPIIRRILAETGCGIHVKTAGTTWLEELIGLCESGDEGAAFVKGIYRQAIEHQNELCAPYATVLDIDARRLPSVVELEAWSCEKLARSIRHDNSQLEFNPHLRQLLHVAFKLAAKRGDEFARLSEIHREVLGEQVFTNLYARHLQPLFVGTSSRL